MLSGIFLSIIILFVLVIFKWIKTRQNFFENHKIPYLQSPAILGAYADVVFGKEGVFEKVHQIYYHPNLKNEKYFGMFLFHKPALFIKDPEIIKQIMITDFNSFSNRFASSTAHDPPGYYQMFLLKNPLWKTIRAKLSPFFSSAKLKTAYYLIEKLGRELNHYVSIRFKNGSNREEFNVKKLTDFFFVDVISSVAFGVEAHTMNNSGSEFYEAANSIFDAKKFWRGFELVAVFLIPQLMKYIRFKAFSHYTTKFIYEVTPHIIEERIKSGKRRNDLIDTLLDIEDKLVPEHHGHTKEDMMYGQIALFLAAGYETSSSTTSFTLYELCKQLELQQKLREEIREALVKYDGKVTFEMVCNSTELPLLHQCIYETLRMYPVFSTLDRECTNNDGVSIDDGNFKIPKGMPILIPVYPLCRDEKYFEDPLKYNPERFSPDNIKKIPSIIANLGFGTGPRFCIGERLGLIQTKVALIMLLKDFRIERNKNTPNDIKFVKKAMIIQSEKKILIDFIKDPLI